MWSGAALALGAVGFGYGVLVGQYHVFPYHYLKGVQDAITKSSGSAGAGLKLFTARCAMCHGPNGEGASGPDLHTDIATSVSHRREVRAVLQRGIPGTAMPDLDLSDSQIANLMAYLETLSPKGGSAGAAEGDVAEGRSLFVGAGGCVSCHRVNGTGGFLGPDLSDVGRRRWASFLRRALLEPSAEISPGYTSVRLVTRSDSTMTGILMNQSAFSVQLLGRDGRLRSMQRSALRSATVDTMSLMPAYGSILDSTQITDLVAYLSTLRSSEAP